MASYYVSEVNSVGVGGGDWKSTHLTNKEALTVLCSVVKHDRKQLEHERSVGGNRRLA